MAAFSQQISILLPIVKESRICTIHKIGLRLKIKKIRSNGKILKAAQTAKKPLKEVISLKSGSSVGVKVGKNN